MSKQYVIQTTDTYRVATVADVEALHEELLGSSDFDLVAFSYRTKFIREKGEVVEEYQLVTAKKVFNNEKEPETKIEIVYEV